MNRHVEMSEEASKVLDLVRDVPALDGERRDRIWKSVLANALPTSAAESATRARGPSSAGLRLPLVSFIVLSAIAGIGIPWMMSRRSGADVGSPSASASSERARLESTSSTRREDSPLPPTTPTEAAPEALDVPTVPSPHALSSAKLPPPRSITPAPSVKLAPRAALSAPTTEPSESAGSAPTSAANEPGATSGSTLQEEVRLVRTADAAIGAHDSARALSLLQDHEHRFPRGVLVAERTMLVVLALCEAGRGADAREQARRFRERYPHSPLQDRLEYSCAGAARP